MGQIPKINSELSQQLGAKAGSAATNSTILYDLQRIAEQVLGRKLPVIESIPEEAKRRELRSAGKTGGKIWGSSDLLGREVFLPISIQTLDGQSEYEFPGCVLALRRSKIVIETPFPEREGSANEIIGFDNWKISMTGFLADPYLQFPEDKLLEVAELEKRQVPDRLKCALYDIFSPANDLVIIKEFNLPSQTGIVGVRKFSLSMISHHILTLEVD